LLKKLDKKLAKVSEVKKLDKKLAKTCETCDYFN